MSDSMNREALLKLMSLVRPALAAQDYIPAYTHIQFAGDYACTFNDIAAIKVRIPADLDLGLCVPGEMLIKTLGSFNAENVALTPGKDASIIVTSGRSKIKMPTLPGSALPLEIPEGGKHVPVLAVGDDLLAGLQRCLISVGNDPTHPAQQGVTLDQEGGKAVLFSTDGTTISRYQTKTKIKLPADAPVILPTFFCAQLVTLRRAYPRTTVELELHSGALVAYFVTEEEIEEAVLFQKTLVDLEPMDFPKVIGKYIDVSGIKEVASELPATFDAAFARALLVLSSEMDKATRVTAGGSSLNLLSVSAAGEASDVVAFENQAPVDPAPFHVDPTLIIRGAKVCSHMVLTSRVVVMATADAQFIHLIAHSA